MKVKGKVVIVTASTRGIGWACVQALSLIHIQMCIRDSIYDPAEGDPDNGVAAGTAFEDIPEDWLCPLCGVGKDQFSVQE